jgi:hypothetical protein
MLQQQRMLLCYHVTSMSHRSLSGLHPLALARVIIVGIITLGIVTLLFLNTACVGNIFVVLSKISYSFYTTNSVLLL